MLSPLFKKHKALLKHYCFFYFCHMPHCSESDYKSPFIYRNGHVSTIYGGAIKSTLPPAYERAQWEMPDGDFLLVDFIVQSKEKAIVLCHGLEGDSKSNYNNSAAHYFLEKGYTVFAWNNRSCGGKLNRLPQLYHHASVDDLEFVIKQILKKGFKALYLLGFSLGGAQILNYFGTKVIPAEIKAGTAVSTPISLKSSAGKIQKGLGKIYANRFIKRIKNKIIAKSKKFPHLLNRAALEQIESFTDLAQTFIVPIHGFSSLSDYFEKASPGHCLAHIQTPVLLLNAQNDPMLGTPDYPIDLAKTHRYIHLELPVFGGHCAFPLKRSKYSYAEMRALQFFKSVK